MKVGSKDKANGIIATINSCLKLDAKLLTSSIPVLSIEDLIHLDEPSRLLLASCFDVFDKSVKG